MLSMHVGRAIVAAMLMQAVQFRRMGKEQSKQAEPARVMVKMDRDIHRRFKIFCVATGQKIEDVGAQWIADRLAIEEKKAK